MQHGAGYLAIASFGDVQRVVDWRAANQVRRACGHRRVGLGRVFGDLRRVVDVSYLDFHRRVAGGGGAPAVGGRYGKGGGAHFRAVADEAQPGGRGAGGKQRGVERLSDGNVNPLRAVVVLQRAAVRQRFDGELQGVGVGRVVVIGIVVGAGAAVFDRRALFQPVAAVGVVRVAYRYLAGGQVSGFAFGDYGGGGAGYHRQIVHWRDVDVQRRRPDIGHRVVVSIERGQPRRDRERRGVDKGLSAVVLEANIAAVEVGLRKGGVFAERHPAAADIFLQLAARCAVRETKEGIDHLRGVHARGGVAQARHAGEVAAGAVQYEDAAFFHFAAGVARGEVHARPGGIAVGNGGDAIRNRAGTAARDHRKADGKGKAGQRFGARRVHAADAAVGRAVGVPAQRSGVVHHHKVEAVGVTRCAGAGVLHVLHFAVDDILHGEGAAVLQAVAVQRQVTVGELAVVNDKAEVVIGGIHVACADHRRRKGDGVRQIVHLRVQRYVVQSRVVIHRAHGQGNGAVGAGRHAGAAALVGDAYAKAVGALVFTAVVSIGQQIAIGIVKGLADGDGDAVKPERAVGRQGGNGESQRCVARIAAAVRLYILADVAGVDRIVGLAFKDHAAAAKGRRLVLRGNVQRDVDGIGLRLRRRAVVDDRRKAVGGVLVCARGGVDILHLAVDQILLGKDRADAHPVAVQRQIAILRQVGQTIDNLHGLLGARRYFRIDGVKGHGGDDAAARFDLRHVLGGVGHAYRVVRRGHGHIDGFAGADARAVAHRDVQLAAGAGVAKLDVSGGKGDAVKPGLRFAGSAGHGQRSVAGLAVAEFADGAVAQAHRDYDGFAGVRGADLPAAERGGIGACGVKAARLGDGDAFFRRGDFRPGQQTVVIKGEGFRFNAAGMVFQHPVAGKRRAAGHVAGGRHVRLSQFGEAGDKGVILGGDVAAVKQDVAAVAKARADSAEL